MAKEMKGGQEASDLESILGERTMIQTNERENVSSTVSSAALPNRSNINSLSSSSCSSNKNYCKQSDVTSSSHLIENQIEARTKNPGTDEQSIEKDVTIAKDEQEEITRKRQRRLAMNHVTARDRRRRKRHHLHNLQSNVDMMTSNNNRILDENNRLKKKIFELGKLERSSKILSL